jgi:hypothetical protein
MVARNRVVISLSYRPARRHSLAELVPWNRFLGSLKVKKFGLSILYRGRAYRQLKYFVIHDRYTYSKNREKKDYLVVIQNEFFTGSFLHVNPQ